MITVRVKIIEYDKNINTCKAQLLNGDIVEIDPYVGCAIELSDEDYADGKDYILTEYTVYKNNIAYNPKIHRISTKYLQVI